MHATRCKCGELSVLAVGVPRGAARHPRGEVMLGWWSRGKVIHVWVVVPWSCVYAKSEKSIFAYKYCTATSTCTMLQAHFARPPISLHLIGLARHSKLSPKNSMVRYTLLGCVYSYLTHFGIFV